MKMNNYWSERLKRERKWQREQLEDLEQYKQEIKRLYEVTVHNINSEISYELNKTKGKTVSAKDMQEYEALAKEAVARAEALRRAGKKVTYSSFSKDVNDRLKIYNASMRINRNELLKSKVGAHLVRLGINQIDSIANKLSKDYLKEIERQAGILELTTRNKSTSSIDTMKKIYNSVGGATFSDRVWSNIDVLKGKLDGLIATQMIQGKNPREIAEKLTGLVSKTVSNHEYVTERLVKTESSRIMFTAQRDQLKRGGYKYCEWYAEAKACKICRKIANNPSEYGDGIYKLNSVPEIPVHPNCMCSIGGLEPSIFDKEPEEIEEDDPISPHVLMDGVKRGKPMSIEEADQHNANLKYLGLTPEKRKQIKDLRENLNPLLEWINDEYKKINNFEYRKGQKDKDPEAWERREAFYNKEVDRYKKMRAEYYKLKQETHLYAINCQRCAPAYELRRRGYDVEALPNPQSTHEITYGIPARMWRNEDGSPSQRTMLEARNNKSVTKELLEKMKPGERGTLSWIWSGNSRSGHIVNVERTEKGLLVIDPQIGEIEETFEDYMGMNKFRKSYYKRKVGVNYNRTDDKFIDLEHIDLIVKAREYDQ